MSWMSILHIFRIKFHQYLVYHCYSISVSLNNRMINPTVNIIRNMNIHASRTIKSLLARTRSQCFLPFFKRTIRLRSMVPRKSFTFVMSRVQYKKKKILTLKFMIKVNFASIFLYTFLHRIKWCRCSSMIRFHRQTFLPILYIEHRN